MAAMTILQSHFPLRCCISESLPCFAAVKILSLTIDFTKMQVLKNDVPVKLSAMEYKLLELLIRNRGQVLTRDLILERLWDCDGNFVDENTLRVLIRRLRQKIETDPKNPKFIVTVFGIGYTFGEAQ